MQDLIQLDTSVQTSKMQKSYTWLPVIIWRGNLITEGIIYLTAARGPHPGLASWEKKKHDTIWGSLIKSERWARLGVCINHGFTDGGIKPVSCWCCRVQSLASPVNPQAFHLQSTGHQAQWSAIGETKLRGMVSRTQEHFDEHRGIQSNMS